MDNLYIKQVTKSIVIGSARASKSTTQYSHSISPLHHNRNPLEEIAGGVHISRLQMHTPLQLPRESPGVGPIAPDV